MTKAEMIAMLDDCPERTFSVLRQARAYRDQGMSEEEAEQELFDRSARDPGSQTPSDLERLKDISAWWALWECKTEGEP